MTVAGLLLAAGAGRRMGTPKALVELNDEPLVTRALRSLREAGASPRIVVLGAAADDAGLVVADADPEAVAVVAPRWADGMGESLRAGLGAVPAEADAVVVLLVDTPGITAAALARVMAAATPAGIVRGVYEGRPGHPVVFGRHHLAAVAAAAHDDVGARGYLAGRDDVGAVEVADVATRDDVDTPADLARLRGQEG